MNIYIPSCDIVSLWKVVPWDESNVYFFPTFLDAHSYAYEHFGMRYDIEEV